MDFDLVAFKDFIKPKHRKEYGSYVPRNYSWYAVKGHPKVLYM